MSSNAAPKRRISGNMAAAAYEKKRRSFAEHTVPLLQNLNAELAELAADMGIKRTPPPPPPDSPPIDPRREPDSDPRRDDELAEDVVKLPPEKE